MCNIRPSRPRLSGVPGRSRTARATLIAVQEALPPEPPPRGGDLGGGPWEPCILADAGRGLSRTVRGLDPSSPSTCQRTGCKASALAVGSWSRGGSLHSPGGESGGIVPSAVPGRQFRSEIRAAAFVLPVAVAGRIRTRRAADFLRHGLTLRGFGRFVIRSWLDRLGCSVVGHRLSLLFL